MIVSNVNTQNVSSNQSNNLSNDAASNRTSFLEMLTGISSMHSSQEDASLAMGEENHSQLLLNLLAPLQQESEEIEINEVEELLNLLPDYLRYEIEELLQQYDGETIDFNDLSVESLTLAQMFVHFIQLLTRQQAQQNATANERLEQMKNMLQQAVKAEAQVTGMSHTNEIIAKLEKMFNTNNESKQTYLQGVMTRLTQSSSKQEQTGLNMSTVVDSTQAMSRAQQFVIHIGEQPTKEAEQRQFIRQFQDIIGRGLLRQLNNGTTQFTIKLHPQHLGRLDIQLLQTNGSIIAKITASTTAARELIEAQLHQLRNTFAQQQINVERIEVNEQQQSYQLNKDGEGKERQDDGRESKNKEEDENKESFANVLNEITFNEKV